MSLATIDQFKERLPDTGLTDAEIQFLLDTATMEMEIYCDTPLEEKIVTNELYSGSGNTNTLTLDAINLQSVEKVEFLNSDGEVDEVVYDPENSIDKYYMQIDLGKGILTINRYFPSITDCDYLTERRIESVRYNNVRVSYTVGFASDNVPIVLQNICLQMAMREYNESYTGEKVIKSESVKSAKTTWATSSTEENQLGLSGKYLSILDEYRKWF